MKNNTLTNKDYYEQLMIKKYIASISEEDRQEIKKEIGTIFIPNLKIIYNISGSSGSFNLSFDGGTKEPITYPGLYNDETFSKKLEELKANRIFPRMIINKINEKSVTVEILDDCYCGVWYEQPNLDKLNYKGRTLRIAFNKNKQLNFI
jgi:hypothetical protein